MPDATGQSLRAIRSAADETVAVLLLVAYWIVKTILTPIFYLLWKVEIEGREHVPTSGPAVLAANHQSFCDSFFLPLAIRRRMTYIAKAEYFDTWRTAWFFRSIGQIPMRREGGEASQRALDTAKDVLSGGGLLGIYPEGTRAPDERLYKGRTGVARLALGCGVPVIPVGLVGTRRVQPPGRMLMRPFHTVTVRFGPPLDLSTAVSDAAHVETSTTETSTTETSTTETSTTETSTTETSTASGDRSRDRDQIELRRVTDLLMTNIARLSGQDYVDHYSKSGRGSGAHAPPVADVSAVEVGGLENGSGSGSGSGARPARRAARSASGRNRHAHSGGLA